MRLLHRLSVGSGLNARKFSITTPRPGTSFVVKVGNHPGALEEVLRVLREESVNLTRIESRPSSTSTWDVFLDADASIIPIKKLSLVAKSVDVLGPLYVPWFPRHKADLDSFTRKTLDAGEDLKSDHPGFTDVAYRTRRENIIKNAQTFRHGDKIPQVQYSTQESQVWTKVYDELRKRHEEYACDEYRAIFDELERLRLFSRNSIPQLQDMSDWLRGKTGWTLRPVTGLLSARDFLNGLAVKCFHSTQYIRHPSSPWYTPEPDIIHELCGHVPLFGNNDFATLSHDIGLASLGASDSDIKRLATCYWFSVEFGLVAQGGKKKAYGAGLLSSFGELEHACDDGNVHDKSKAEKKPDYLPWDPQVAAETEYPITSYQSKYFVAESLPSAAELIRRFCMFNMTRPFYARFDENTGQIVTVDRQVKRHGSVTEG